MFGVEVGGILIFIVENNEKRFCKNFDQVTIGLCIEER